MGESDIDDAAGSPVPADLVDLERYDLLDPTTRAALVARARADLAAVGCVTLDGFVRPSATIRLAAEAMAARSHAHRRENMNPIYGLPADATLPSSHPINRRHLSRMDVIPTDVLDEEGAILRLYRWDGLTRLVADMLGESELYRVADPMMCCNLTILGAGGQHAWHFDSNDFVVSLLLQDAEAGGAFEYAPFIRSEADENYDGVAAVLDGVSTSTRSLRLAPGTLSLFCGKRSVHRVTEVAGGRARIIALFSYDRLPNMMFAPEARRRVFGRTEPLVRSL